MGGEMSTLKRYDVHLGPEQLRLMREIYVADGVKVSEQIRRAIDLWLQARGAVKAERKRPASRKRS